MDYKIKDLFLKYINGQCSREELDEVFSHIESGTRQAEWDSAIEEDVEHVLASDRQSNLTSSEVNRMYEAVESRLSSPGVSSLRQRTLRLWWPVSIAATILIVMSAGYLLFNRKDSTQSLAVKPTVVHPGGNKAFLTLSNGKKISLTDAANGSIAAQAGIKIIKTADGQIIYTTENSSAGSGSSQYNTIETPRGGQYQVRLPDGTSVWLNAASKLVYPVNFHGSKERRIQLDGEAYFEVAKDKNRPFIVKTGKQEVTVLGTHFNINGYKDEPIISTTLMEGSIKTSNTSSGNSRILSPGQQSTVFSGDGAIDVRNVNTENIISWKNGYFIFDNQDITSIMKVIGRWYDVNIDYQSINKEEKFGGTFSRSSDLDDILKVLKILGNVDFKVEGRTIVVSN
ncbi:FecR family protein [Arcticibacter tournemirensis]|uniref:FecR family protein n=1 Tax=Arcticibacter tournemirensis TaxID=699437 RepID=A0A4V1KIY4_9SPHI|nr:FecR family protein [Arcticibacter tournemirensis]KAA8477178.1 FecR family protein [Arcticibacter tournemirensis]RXF72302.1 FecR family protein [Arcticibacter tournemirensis]TQM51173.1 FecR family protein [Arcticibacter tournemirensis]